MLSTVAVFAILSLASGLGVNFKDCGSTKGKINSISVSPCEVEPCFLRRGHNTSISVSYTAGEATGSLKAVVHGIIAGLPIPFPLPNSDGCMGSVNCPMSAGKTYTYSATLPVYMIYPKIKVIVKWELRDSDDNNVFCFALPVEISD